MHTYLLTLFRMGFFGAAHGWEGGAKRPPLPKMKLLPKMKPLPNDETWHSYTLPKEVPKTI